MVEGVVDSTTGKVVSRATSTGTVFWDVNTGAAGADGEGTGDGVGPGAGGTGVGKNVGCMGDKRGGREGTVWPKLVSVLRMLAGFSFLFPIWKN